MAKRVLRVKVQSFLFCFFYFFLVESALSEERMIQVVLIESEDELSAWNGKCVEFLPPKRIVDPGLVERLSKGLKRLDRENLA